MIKTLLIIGVLMTALPVGYLIAWFTREELKAGREWFKLVIVGSIIGLIASILLKSYSAALTCAYAVVVSGVSLSRSD